MASDVITDIIDLWSDLNPVVGYTSGHLTELTGLFTQSAANMEAMRSRIEALNGRVSGIVDANLRMTAAAVLASLRTQINLSRPSGAGPSGTGMGGIYAAADGIFYIVLKGDAKATFVPGYLAAVLEMVKFETRRWWGQDFTILVRRECIDTVTYMKGTIASLSQLRPDLKPDCDAILAALADYQALFHVDGLDSNDFKTYWPIFRKWDAIAGPAPARGYPACLGGYYKLTETATQIETTAQAWLDLDMPVTVGIAQQVASLPLAGRG
jgi:hypothetical protein